MRSILIALVLIALSSPTLAAKRIALLIGNQDYTAEVGRLKNPINDVNLIAASLRKIGFAKGDIRIVKNGKRRDILRALDRHASKLKSAGDDAIGFLYYSGHGVANAQNQRNYLIPVGVKRLDADVWYDAIRLDQIVTALQDTASNAAHFVIFDACRNLLNTKTKGSKGFVPILTRRGMLIAFSTDPGQTASDEGNGSGPYCNETIRQALRALENAGLIARIRRRTTKIVSRLSQITGRREEVAMEIQTSNLYTFRADRPAPGIELMAKSETKRQHFPEKRSLLDWLSGIEPAALEMPATAGSFLMSASDATG